MGADSFTHGYSCFKQDSLQCKHRHVEDDIWGNMSNMQNKQSTNANTNSDCLTFCVQQLHIYS